MKKQFLFVVWLMLSMQHVQAQRALLIKKQVGTRSYQFLEGERLVLKLADTGEILKGTWQYANANTLVMAGQEVALSNIRWVDVSKKEKGIWLLRKGQDLLIIAGIGYFGVTQLNHLIEQGEFAGKDQVSWSSTIGLVAGGVVCGILDRTLRRRKISLGGSQFGAYLLDEKLPAAP